MSIEAMVKPPFPRIVGTPWQLNGHFGYTAGAAVTIHEITAPVVNGHRYRVTVSASGYVSCEGGKHRTFMIGTDSDTIASQRFGFDRGGFSGLMSVPIALSGLWTATADAAAKVFSFIMTRDDATGDADWELSNCRHQMWVEDLGP